AIVASFNGMTVLETHNKQIRDGSGNLYDVPSVMLLHQYHKFLDGWAPYSKRNVHIRDDYVCQYCEKQMFPGSRDLTIDHVISRNKWTGKENFNLNSFENIVTCCNKCNAF